MSRCRTCQFFPTFYAGVFLSSRFCVHLFFRVCFDFVLFCLCSFVWLVLLYILLVYTLFVGTSWMFHLIGLRSFSVEYITSFDTDLQYNTITCTNFNSCAASYESVISIRIVRDFSNCIL